MSEDNRGIVKLWSEMKAEVSEERAIGHPPGFHKSEEARSLCWGCSHPERLAPKPGDEDLARKLIAEGWLSTSNKYSTVARSTVPPASEAIIFSADVPAWLRGEVLEAYVRATRSGLRLGNGRDGVEHMQLTVAQFRAFKRLGGGCA